MAPALEQSGISFNSIDRCFKLMGHVGHKIRLQNFCRFQFFCHQIKAVIQILNFFQPASRLQSDSKIALGHLAHGLAQPCDLCKEHFIHNRHGYRTDDDTQHHKPDICGKGKRDVQKQLTKNGNDTCYNHGNQNLSHGKNCEKEPHVHPHRIQSFHFFTTL